MRRLSLLCVLLFLGAAFGSTDPYEGKTDMNGFHLSDFKGFPNDWEAVTVRYRQDSGEMRFVYANKLAAEALRQGRVDFPDGAVFGKIGRKTESDPAFTSSLVPTGAKRFQFMVRDRRRFKGTAGWGYALFDANGKTFPGEPHQAELACAACHELAQARGYVFSQFPDRPYADQLPGPGETFEPLRRANLPERIRRWLPDSESELLSLQGPVRGHVFTGTLDEIVPSLASKTARSGKPTVLLAEDRRRFVLVFTDRLSRDCASPKKALMTIRGAPEIQGEILKKPVCL